jgi:hypothetical protein
VSLQTEFEFTLPKGYVDDGGVLHRTGLMRLATARDEIEPLRDPRITGPEDPYLTLAILARVVVRLGSIEDISVRHVEALFAADLAYLQDLYGIINFGDEAEVEALRAASATASPFIDEPAPSGGPDDTEVDPIDVRRVRARVEEVAGGAQP